MVEATSGLKSVEEQKLRMATFMLKIVKTKTKLKEHHLCVEIVKKQQLRVDYLKKETQMERM